MVVRVPIRGSGTVPRMTSIDPLTQLASRQHFIRFLEEQWLCAAPSHGQVALLIVDVDFFQRFNETRGSQAGDACLSRLAAVIAARIKRASDLAARYGGEEFAVVLSGADEAGALGVAHWLRAEIEQQGIPHGASSVSDYVTVSIGVAVGTPLAGGSPERLIAAAEAALSRAKELGRNAVIAGPATNGSHAGTC